MMDSTPKREPNRILPMSLPNVIRFPGVSARVGAWLLPLFQRRATALRAGRLSSKPTVLEDLLIAGLVRTHLQRGTLAELTAMHDWFWANPAALRFHEFAEKRFQHYFLEHHVAIVPELRAALALDQVAYGAVCEIGCGSGRVLRYLAETLNEIPRFIGLDLSPAQIDRNRARYAGSTIEFEAGDGAAWIAGHAKPAWAYFTYGGVLEYFSRRKVHSLFSTIASRLSPALFVLVEPLSADQELGTHCDSKPYGAENTFSHDYIGLLLSAGFAILHRSEQNFDGQRWLLVVAKAA